jgi:hypothetical protein
MMKLNFRSVSTSLALAFVLSEPCLASHNNKPFGITNQGLANLDRSSTAVNNLKSSWAAVPRGGSGSAPVSSNDVGSADSVGEMVVSAVKGLTSYMAGPKADTLLLLLTTALNTPFCKMLGTSPILGFLALGVLFGPNGFSLIKDIHTTESTFPPVYV